MRWRPNSDTVLSMPVAELGKRYRIKFIEPGIVNYHDLDAGIVFVDKPALDNMAPSIVGIPVVLGVHEDPEDRERFRVGVVTDEPWWEDGWQWTNMMVFDDDALSALDNADFSVSCAYVPTKIAGPGRYHGIRYDAQVLDGSYRHMAIVEKPRYEGALVFTNSNKELRRMKLFRSRAERKAKSLKDTRAEIENEEEEPEEPEEEMENEEDGETMSDDAYVELDNGTQIPVSELINNWKADQKRKRQLKNAPVNMDDEIDVGDGKRVSVKELVGCYTRTNAEPPQDEEAEDLVDENKQESSAITNSRRSKPKPNRNFSLIKNASQDPEANGIAISTKDARIARGKERYGRPVNNKKGAN